MRRWQLSIARHLLPCLLTVIPAHHGMPCTPRPPSPLPLQVQRELECSTCGRTSRVVEEYMHLSLELPEPQVGACSVYCSRQLAA